MMARANSAEGPEIEGLAKVRHLPTTGNWGGAVVTDLDNDGIADVMINGKGFLFVFRGLGGGEFELANEKWGIPLVINPAVDKGLCYGDIDNDGRLDLVTYGPGSGDNRTIAVLHNDLPARNWFVRHVGRKGNRAAAGSTIRLYESGTKKLLWAEQVCIYGRQSFHSSYFPVDTDAHFGLGDRTVVDVSVEFIPPGRRC